MTAGPVPSQHLEADLDRIAGYWRRSQQYRTHDPESALTQARKAAEVICERLAASAFQQAAREHWRQFDHFLAKLEKHSVIPPDIANHLRLVQKWGNFGTHDQGSDSARITPESVGPCLLAFRALLLWYIRDHLERGDVAAKLLGNRALDSHTSDTNDALTEWRERFWWAQRNQPPRHLDIRAADALQESSKISESDTELLRAAFRRDVETFRLALTDAFEDGTVDVAEADALELIRIESCISRQEATLLVQQLVSGSRISAPPWPGWLDQGVWREFSGDRPSFRGDIGSGASLEVQKAPKPNSEALGDTKIGHHPPAPTSENASQTGHQGRYSLPTAQLEVPGLRHLLSRPPSERASLLVEIVQTSGCGAIDAVAPQVWATVRSACQIRAGEEPVCYFDLTLLGSAADACVVTSDAIYVHNPWYSPHAGLHRLAWADFISVDIKLRESEIVLESDDSSVFIWSWNEQKRIKRVLQAIQRFLMNAA